MAQRITGRIDPDPSLISFADEKARPESELGNRTRLKKKGFVQRQVSKIMRFRKERAARKAAAKAAPKKKGFASVGRETESAIQKRQRRQREELEGN